MPWEQDYNSSSRKKSNIIYILIYEYSRVRGLIDSSVNIKGCSTKLEVTGIGPLNNHAFFGQQTRDITEIGLIPYILAYSNDEFSDYQLLPIPDTP